MCSDSQQQTAHLWCQEKQDRCVLQGSCTGRYGERSQEVMYPRGLQQTARIRRREKYDWHVLQESSIAAISVLVTVVKYLKQVFPGVAITPTMNSAQCVRVVDGRRCKSQKWHALIRIALHTKLGPDTLDPFALSDIPGRVMCFSSDTRR